MPDQTLQAQIGKLITDPVFWFSTVIIGIIVSILGNFATNIVQRVMSWFSTTAKRQMKEREKAFQRDIDDLLANPSRVTDMKIDSIYSLIRTTFTMILFLIFSNFIFIIPYFGIAWFTPIFMIFTTVIVVAFASTTFIEEIYNRRLINEFHNQRATIIAAISNSAIKKHTPTSPTNIQPQSDPPVDPN